MKRRIEKMNKIILSGGITRDAELSFLPGTGTPKMAFSLAVERGYQKDKNNKKTNFAQTVQQRHDTRHIASVTNTSMG